MKKINVGRIITDHYRTFGGNARALRFLLPALLLPTLLCAISPLGREACKSVALAGPLIALVLSNGLFHLLRLASGPCSRGSHAELRGTLIREAHANLSFALLASVLIIIPAALRLLVTSGPRLCALASFAVYALAAAIAGALLAYLGRLHALVAAELALD